MTTRPDSLPPTTSLEVRQRLVEALKLDLVGPSADHALVEERLRGWERPSNGYLTGFLIPSGTSPEKSADADEDDDLGEVPESAGLAEESNEERKAAKKSFFPSSMGLSFLVPRETQTLAVLVRWGDYEQTEIEGADSKPMSVWQRKARAETVDVALNGATSDPSVYDLHDSGSLQLHIVEQQIAAEELAGQIPHGTRAVSVFLVNHRAPAADEPDVAYAFQAELEVRSDRPFVPRPDLRGARAAEWDEQVADLHYADTPAYATGHGISAEWDTVDGRCHVLRTAWIPTAEVEKTETVDMPGVELSMKALGALPDGVAAETALHPLVDQYRAWIQTQSDNLASLPEARQSTAEELLRLAGLAADRIERGIATLANDADSLDAFRVANRAVARALRTRLSIEAPSWRAFQLAFILLNLPGLADPRDPHREVVDLLFFPTGGGKTEAYLGLAAFAMVLRRLRHPGEKGLSGAGVSVIMRYPHGYREAPHVRLGPRRRLLRCPDRSQDRARAYSRRLPLVVARYGDRRKRAISDAPRSGRLGCRGRGTVDDLLSNDTPCSHGAERRNKGMFITKTHLPRRTVLRGLGATIALPLLDGMVPALTALSRTAAAPVRRLGVFYVPNGMSMPYWFPKDEGPLSEADLPPTLQSLNKFKDRVLLLGGLDDESANLVKGGGDHARSAGTFLTCVPFKITTGADVYAAVSMDQIAARELSKETQLASIELGIESNAMVGNCDGGASCAYTNTIAWRTPTTPLPIENDPRAVFEQLFGTSGSTDPKARLARRRRDRSILDAVGDELQGLERVIGPGDRVKLDEYLDALRDVERRIDMAEQQSLRELPVVDQPVGVPSDYAEHATLMMDLLALAYQTDLTRISTFMLAREVSGRAYPEIGVPDSHHPLSHHQDEAAKLARLHKINEYHFRQFAYLVEKLAGLPEGDGTMLDSTLFLYGTGISDSNTHFHDDLPIALVGGRAAGIKGGRYIRYPQDTPLANLHVTILEKLGVPVEALGDSTGQLDRLTGV